jgi:chaperonin cofactor prefoldin
MKLRAENAELGLKIDVLEKQNKKLQEEVAELNNKLKGVQINKVIKNGK